MSLELSKHLIALLGGVPLRVLLLLIFWIVSWEISAEKSLASTGLHEWFPPPYLLDVVKRRCVMYTQSHLANLLFLGQRKGVYITQ